MVVGMAAVIADAWLMARFGAGFCLPRTASGLPDFVSGAASGSNCLPFLLSSLRVCNSIATSLGLHFDCSSGFEVERAILAGVPPQSLCLR